MLYNEEQVLTYIYTKKTAEKWIEVALRACHFMKTVTCVWPSMDFILFSISRGTLMSGQSTHACEPNSMTKK
jgi:hypothetical protein